MKYSEINGYIVSDLNLLVYIHSVCMKIYTLIHAMNPLIFKLFVRGKYKVFKFMFLEILYYKSFRKYIGSNYELIRSLQLCKDKQPQKCKFFYFNKIIHTLFWLWKIFRTFHIS